MNQIAGGMKKANTPKRKVQMKLEPNSIEMQTYWSGSKLMWRTNESLIVKIYFDGMDFFQVMIGNSDSDEEYLPIYLQKSKIIIDESQIKRNVRASQEANWRLEEEDLKKQFLLEFYGNFVLSRLAFTERNEETGNRNVIIQKSASDDDAFDSIFLNEAPEHIIAPPSIQKPQRRTFEDFINSKNHLERVQSGLKRQTMAAAKSQKALQLSIEMLDALKYSSRNATGLRKLKLIALRGIFQKQVVLYKQRLESSPIYHEMLATQEEVRKREEHLANLPSSVPNLPPISPRQSQLISPRA